MISPGPLVRQKGRPGHSSDSRLFWKAVRSEGAGFCRFLAGGGARKVCSFRTLSARQGRARKVLPCRLAVGCGKARHTAFRRQSPCERVLRTRSRRPTPSRRCRAVVSKEGISREQGSVVPGHRLHAAFVRAQRFFNALSGLCCGGMSLSGASFCFCW